VRLRPDASLTDDGGTVTLATPARSATFRAVPPGARAALDSLAAGDTTDGALLAAVVAGDGEAGLLRWHLYMRRLVAEGWLEYRSGGARLVPVGPGPSSPAPPLDPDALVRLSRLAVATAAGGEIHVRSPRGPNLVALAPHAVGTLGALADRVAAADAGDPDDLRLFAGAGVLDFAAEESAAVAHWPVADLWLHAHSRGPHVTAGYGGTYPMKGRAAPLPATPEPFPGERVPLDAPDLRIVAKADPPLTEVMERRRSGREHRAEAPITRAQLGELLYRTMRQRQTFTAADGQELADRPYPSGGSIHELEVYPLVVACDGVEPGLWHYDTAGHALERVAEPGPALRVMVERARTAALMEADPQVVLVVTARFGRVMWKYESIAYALVLKHVGVLYHSFYLVGTAMGLAVCGLGGGDAADFERVTGRDYYAEGSVGELVIGSAP
jgi:SagB-type dehydrogenase family enzyme